MRRRNTCKKQFGSKSFWLSSQFFNWLLLLGQIPPDVVVAAEFDRNALLRNWGLMSVMDLRPHLIGARERIGTVEVKDFNSVGQGDAPSRICPYKRKRYQTETDRVILSLHSQARICLLYARCFVISGGASSQHRFDLLH
jgi:hypothetical protein